jgi:hypothetical protein
MKTGSLFARLAAFFLMHPPEGAYHDPAVTGRLSSGSFNFDIQKAHRRAIRAAKWRGAR